MKEVEWIVLGRHYGEDKMKVDKRISRVKATNAAEAALNAEYTNRTADDKQRYVVLLVANVEEIADIDHMIYHFI